MKTKVGVKVTVELETTASSLEINSYDCAIRIKNKYFSNLIIVGQIPRKISRHVQFSSRQKAEKLMGMLNL